MPRTRRSKLQLQLFSEAFASLIYSTTAALCRYDVLRPRGTALRQIKRKVSNASRVKLICIPSHVALEVLGRGGMDCCVMRMGVWRR